MDYRRVYAEFIADRRGREAGLTKWETHHIVPRHLKGLDTPENLIRLSLQDHLFSHMLLANMHGGQLAVSFLRMCGMRKYEGRRSRQRFEALRLEQRQTLSKMMSGKPKTAEARRNMSIAQSRPETKAKRDTPESRLKKSLALRGRKKPEGFGAKVAEAWKDPVIRAARGKRWGQPHTPESSLKISIANKGRKPTSEQLVKMRKPRSPEGKAAIQKGRKEWAARYHAEKKRAEDA